MGEFLRVGFRDFIAAKLALLQCSRPFLKIVPLSSANSGQLIVPALTSFRETPPLI